MAGRGVHFALTDEQAAVLTDGPALDDEGLIAFIQGVEEAWDKEWLQETDKTWDAIHRCLTDGHLHWGDTALHDCILGGDNLYEGDDYVVNFLGHDQVQETAAAIQGIDREEFRRRYDAIDVASYGELSDDDFDYSYSWFPQLQDFFRRAAAANRAVLFSVDQ